MKLNPENSYGPDQSKHHNKNEQFGEYNNVLAVINKTVFLNSKIVLL